MEKSNAQPPSNTVEQQVVGRNEASTLSLARPGRRLTTFDREEAQHGLPIGTDGGCLGGPSKIAEDLGVGGTFHSCLGDLAGETIINRDRF